MKRRCFVASIAMLYLLSVQTVQGHSKGASTCLADARLMEKMSPVNSSMSRKSPLVISSSVTTYPGKSSPSNFESHNISFRGNSSIRGFLLYAEDCFGKRVGKFTVDTLRGTEGISREQTQEPCRGPTTITHTNNREKSGKQLVFKWTPPEMNVGPITFYAAVVMSFKEWYILDPVTISTELKPRQICDWMVNGSNVDPPDRSAMALSTDGQDQLGSGNLRESNSIQLGTDGHQNFDQNFVFDLHK